MYFICSDSYVYCTMDEYVDFLKENYTFKVDEDKRGMKVVFTSKDSLTEDGIIWFEPAKRGWSKKPLQQRNTYIIVDAYFVHIFEFLRRYFNLEDQLTQVRGALIQLSMEIMDDYFSSGRESSES